VPALASGRDEARGDGVAILAGKRNDLGLESLGGDGLLDGFADRDGDARAEPAKEAAFGVETQGVAPHAIDGDRDDGRGGSRLRFSDALVAALKGQEIAAAGDLAFGEDTDQFSGLDFPAASQQALDGLAGALKIDGNGAEEAEERRSMVENGLPRNPADQARRGATDQQGIGIGDMVGDQDGAAARGELSADLETEAQRTECAKRWRENM
jgi:hypothetical protein